ncbi:hypothetical protein [Streptomyces chartreusis]|uniref:hypothetical protein n=1 Tax=Streptomyces chartreusis TaxID=1969 RepID=UPI0038026DCA
MQHPFKHPLATHHSMEVLGFRRNGSPIYAIAGGNGADEGGSGSGANSGGDGGAGAGGQGGSGDGGQGAGQGGQGSGGASVAAGGQSGAGSGDGDDTDWKAEAKKWESRSKANFADLEKLRAANMSEQEKAVSEAEHKGRTAAATEYGQKLASAEFRAAVAAAGLDLGEAAELIDVNRFVGEDSEVNVAAIKSAVTKLSKLAPARGAGRSGGDLGGGGGSGDQDASIDKQIEEATKARDFPRVIRLKRQKAAQNA